MKKNIIYFINILFIILVLSFFTGFFKEGTTDIELNIIDKIVKVDYGKKISLEPKDYLQNSEDILKEITVSTNIPLDQNSKGKVERGEYNIQFSFKNKSEVVEIIVE